MKRLSMNMIVFKTEANVIANFSTSAVQNIKDKNKSTQEENMPAKNPSMNRPISSHKEKAKEEGYFYRKEKEQMDELKHKIQDQSNNTKKGKK